MLKNIGHFSVSICTNQELRTVTDLTDQIVRTHCSQDERAMAILAPLRGLVEEMEEALKSVTYNPVMFDVMRRQEVLARSLGRLTGYLRWQISNGDDPGMVDAAKSLLAICVRQGSRVMHRSLAHIATALTVMVEELGTDQARAYATLLQAEGMVSALLAAKGAFDQVYQQKLLQDPSVPSPGARSIRNRIAYRLNAILRYVDVLVEDSPQTWAGLASQLNEVIGSVMLVARSRRTRVRNSHLLSIEPQPQAVAAT